MTHSEIMAVAKDEMNNLCKKFADSTSMHGIRRILGDESRHRRILWAFCFLGGIAWTLFSLTTTLTSFYEYPIATLVTVQYAKAMTFPTVTICNMNPIRASKVHNATKEEFLRQQDPSQDGLWSSQEAIYRFAETFSPGQRKDMGHQIKDMIVGCYFDSTPCNADNFTTIYSTRYSNCYSVNNYSTWVTRSSGSESGLQLMLNSEPEEYLSPALFRGVVVLLTSREYPFPEIGGILVESGRQTLIAIKQEEIRRLPKPHGHCYKEETMQNHHMNPFVSIGYNYSFTSCMKTCYQTLVMAYCNCCDASYPCVQPETTSANHCTRSHTECMKKVERGLLLNRRGEACSTSCPVACDTITYTPFITTVALPPVTTKKSSMRGDVPCAHGESNNNISLVIFFNDMTYQMFTDIPAYDWPKLISDVGGQMGLCLGLSLITSFEIVELLIDTVLLVVKAVIRKLLGK